MRAPRQDARESCPRPGTPALGHRARQCPGRRAMLGTERRAGEPPSLAGRGKTKMQRHLLEIIKKRKKAKAKSQPSLRTPVATALALCPPHSPWTSRWPAVSARPLPRKQTTRQSRRLSTRVSAAKMGSHKPTTHSRCAALVTGGDPRSLKQEQSH